MLGFCAGMCIDKQKALRRDCIYNIESMDLEIVISCVYLHLLLYTQKNNRRKFRFISISYIQYNKN